MFYKLLTDLVSQDLSHTKLLGKVLMIYLIATSYIIKQNLNSVTYKYLILAVTK